MPDDPSIESRLANKLYFRIGEVGSIADVPVSVLRFWETEFTQIKPKRTSSGQRMYRKNDVELILKIKELLYDKKFTIPGAKQFLSGSLKQPDRTFPLTLEEIRDELIEIRDLLDQKIK